MNRYKLTHDKEAIMDMETYDDEGNPVIVMRHWSDVVLEWCAKVFNKEHDENL